MLKKVRFVLIIVMMLSLGNTGYSKEKNKIEETYNINKISDFKNLKEDDIIIFTPLNTANQEPIITTISDSEEDAKAKRIEKIKNFGAIIKIKEIKEQGNKLDIWSKDVNILEAYNGIDFSTSNQPNENVAKLNSNVKTAKGELLNYLIEYDPNENHYTFYYNNDMLYKFGIVFCILMLILICTIIIKIIKNKKLKVTSVLL